ncbi:MAG TPA: 16S rRNA (adenine(1518)-N(6)/adenine(1519)-N(6))-dimethyltransferase RsmA [Candidatus Saccharimonadales bacterium]|nr:16S rRNA (adenine(1518)-N(6)/adenine(1519)-N(6))-dimethyltransferase RsmA [Candidatus Saccharimonadales bacterium]
MDLTNPQDVKTAVQLAGLTARKGLGQHFLVDRESLEAVVAAGELDPDDTVLEVGPGLGVMTTTLTQTVRQVVAVEMDPMLVELLERDRPPNLEVIQSDIRAFDLRHMPPRYKVVANIPYYVTSQLFRLFLESANRPQLLALLVQKEVAERLTAGPGRMSVLALSVQYYGQPTLLRVVERHKFWPPPKVDSAVIQIRVYDQPAFAADRAQLFRLIKAGFGEKRKLLKNSLAGGLNISLEVADQLVVAAKLGATARAQELGLNDWERLYRAAVKAGLL